MLTFKKYELLLNKFPGYFANCHKLSFDISLKKRDKVAQSMKSIEFDQTVKE